MSVLPINSKTIAPASESGHEDDQDFSIIAPTEILFILNAVREEKSLAGLYLVSNNRTILSSILDIDPEKKILIFDYGSDEPLNQLALRTGTLQCITTQNRIRIEFDCNNLQRIRFEDREAFSADFPVSLRRLQRRNFYRIATPVANPAVCSIPPPQQPEETSITFNLLDISCGGMALIGQPDADISLDIGMILGHCRIDLPEFGTIETTLWIRDTGTVILKNGLSCPRISCEFMELSEKSRALIQRYIIRLEQQERKLSSKMHF